MKKEIIQAIRNAMQALSCKGKASVKMIDSDRFSIRLNGVQFGIYDMQKNTFID